jgi:hypothetical protein
MSGEMKFHEQSGAIGKLLLSQLILDDAPGATVVFFKSVYELLLNGANTKEIYRKASMTSQGSVRHLKRLEKLNYIHKPYQGKWEMNPIGTLVRDRDLVNLMKGGNHVGLAA